MGSDGRIVQPAADPFAMNSPDFDNLDVHIADGVDPIDRWLGRPGHIWVKGTVPGSPAVRTRWVSIIDSVLNVEGPRKSCGKN